MRGSLRTIACAAALAACLVLPATASADEPVSYLFDGAITAQGQTPDAPPPGANDPTCKPSRAHPRPVILVHGLFANRTVNWNAFSPLIANEGYCVYALTYGTREGFSVPGYQPGGLNKMQQSAADLKAFVNRVLRRTGARRVDIVGHSEGSLMPNYYVKFLGGAEKVRSYVGLTTLWRGTNPAGLATLNDLAEAFGLASSTELIDSNCASCRQFLAGSPFIERMNRGGVAHPKVTYTNIVTRYDELVMPYTSGLMTPEPNVTNIDLQAQCPIDLAEHLAVAFDPNAGRNVLTALDPKHAQAVHCVPVLPLLGGVG